MRRHRGLMFALVASLCLSTAVAAPAWSLVEPVERRIELVEMTLSLVEPVENSDLPRTVLAELSTYWTTVFPASFGINFAALRGGVVPMDSGATVVAGQDAGALCIPNPAQITGNMYYCPSADGIVYDTGVLVPVLLHHYGQPGLISSFAHEFGHAVASRVGISSGDPVTAELQADCFAGNFLGWVSTGGSAALKMPAEQLIEAFQPILDFRDQISVRPSDPGSHGLGIDRAQALLLGVQSDPAVCRDLTTDSISLALGRVPSTAEKLPRFENADAVYAAAGDSLLTTGIVTDVSTAGSPVADDIETARTIGQFGLATSWVLTDLADDACRTGAWTEAVYGAASGLGSWTGDVDEALDLIRYRSDASTDDLFDFISGFASGCA